MARHTVSQPGRIGIGDVIVEQLTNGPMDIFSDVGDFDFRACSVWTIENVRRSWAAANDVTAPSYQLITTSSW